MDEPDLFSVQLEPELKSQLAFLERLRAFVAPVANQSDAVIKDVTLLEWAHAVYAAFGDLDVTGEGLTVAEIESACGGADQETFGSRLAVFKAMGLVAAPRDQRFHRRLVFSSTGIAALLVYDRLSRGSGVQEILILLDQTRQGILDGVLEQGEVANKLITLRRALAISAGELLLLRTRPVEELLEQRRNHRAADQLLTDARTLVEVVETRFPELSSAGGQLITQALRYSAAANDLVDRLLLQVTAERDFSMLLPEQYRTAALYSDTTALSAVFARTVFDKPRVTITPEQILLTLEQHRPREVRRRPPRPVDLPQLEDPIERARRRREALKQRRKAVVQLLLKGQDEVDLTCEVEKAGWPKAARLVTDLLASSADPDIPVTVALSKVLLVNSAALVTYNTPIRLVRVTKVHSDE